MKSYKDLDDEPGGVELDACDRADIEYNVRGLAEHLSFHAVCDPKMASALVTLLRGDPDAGELALSALEIVLRALGERWPLAVDTVDKPDANSLRGAAMYAIKDIAYSIADDQRDALTRKHIEENT